ncbi:MULTISPECIES: hypothetical protein [Streptomyces]|uniref:Uncharacterized protein n=1 Tax=Streptomyces dengpaensis TaxID=2049881 RepID=A0ABM6SLU1_9ACTN|nr:MULTISPECIES: hypothetical protein [Streptomyces]AVH55627.1 hypothetical protein C4B68_07335 [Streptomyces dengpaensis]PIB11888.1 hypothetical protein B1C81_01295 [Streptomyces sp. HG99]
MVARPRSGHRSCHEGIAIPARHPRTHAPSTAEAGAWADVLVRHQLLHAAVLAPNGQWLVQHRPESPVRILDGATAMVELAAEIQHRIRTTRNHTR